MFLQHILYRRARTQLQELPRPVFLSAEPDWVKLCVAVLCVVFHRVRLIWFSARRPFFRFFFLVAELDVGCFFFFPCSQKAASFKFARRPSTSGSSFFCFPTLFGACRPTGPSERGGEGAIFVSDSAQVALRCCWSSPACLIARPLGENKHTFLF